MDEIEFDPVSPREALLEIRRLYAAAGISDDLLGLLGRIDVTAQAGLNRRAPQNFELNDELGDRLAKALKVLSELRENGDVAALSGEIDEALVLPPDIEAMVERRVGRIG